MCIRTATSFKKVLSWKHFGNFLKFSSIRGPNLRFFSSNNKLTYIHRWTETMTSLVLTFITIVTFTTIVSGERICSEGAFDRTMDQKLTCGIFKTVAADLFICSKLCADTIKCFSTNTYEADNGTEMCDLIKGSKESLKYCFVGQQGSVYNEITVGSSLVNSNEFCHPITLGRLLPLDHSFIPKFSISLYKRLRIDRSVPT